MSERVWGVVLLLTVVLGFAACEGDDTPDSAAFTEALARELLPAAASVDPKAMEAVARLGARVTPADVGYDDALPLLALTTMVDLPREWPPPDDDAVPSPPPYALEELAHLLADNAWTKAHGGRPTLLSPEFMKSVTIEQEGDEARGVVRFGPEDGFTGTVHFEAKRVGETWVITALELPRQGIRTVRKDGKWHVDKVPIQPPPLMLSVPHASHVEAPPSLVGLVSIYVLPSGDVEFGDETWRIGTARDEEQAASLRAIGERLGARKSLSGVAILADASTRWTVPAWILALCARLHIPQTYLVAKSSVDGRVGVLRVRLEGDAVAAPGGHATPILEIELTRLDARSWGNAYTRVRVGARPALDLPRGWQGRENALDPAPYDAVVARVRGAIDAELARLRGAAAKREVRGEIRVGGAAGACVHCEDVVMVVGLLRQAGIDDVRCPRVDLPR